MKFVFKNLKFASIAVYMFTFDSWMEVFWRRENAVSLEIHTADLYMSLLKLTWG